MGDLKQRKIASEINWPLLQLQRRKRQTTKEEKQEEEVQDVEQPLFESMPMPVGPKQEQQRPRRYITFTKLMLLHTVSL